MHMRMLTHPISRFSLSSTHPPLLALSHLHHSLIIHSLPTHPSTHPQAEPLLVALTTTMRDVCPDHPDTTVAVANLAAVYFQQRRMHEAKPVRDSRLEDFLRLTKNPKNLR